jgi:hypothetical protein
VTGPKARRLPQAVDFDTVIEEVVRRYGAVDALVLIGGVALQAYGIVRATKDVDFAVTQAGSAAVERMARAAGVPVSPLRIGGVSVPVGGASADFIDRRVEVEPLFLAAIAAAKASGFTVEAGAVSVLVVPLEYLVALKAVGVRPQDEADIARLLRIDELDYPRARAIVEQHLGGVAARYLDRAARLAGREDAPRPYEDEDGSGEAPA